MAAFLLYTTPLYRFLYKKANKIGDFTTCTYTCQLLADKKKALPYVGKAQYLK
jgi:hypothetical protein